MGAALEAGITPLWPSWFENVFSVPELRGEEDSNKHDSITSSMLLGLRRRNVPNE
jgi:hypothetical protein